MGPIEVEIATLIKNKFKPTHFQIWNESIFHGAPAGSESHFKMIVISESFNGLTKVKRHQAVYSCLDSIFKAGLHALALRTHTPTEWSEMTEEEKDFPSVGHH